MKIVTLCTCGLGTCFILKVKTEEVLAGLGLSWEVVPCDLSSSQMEQADLYLVPYGMDVDLISMRKIPVIMIHDVVNTEEIREKLVTYLNASPH